MDSCAARSASKRASQRRGHQLTLERLRVFVAVAEREHVTRTAHDLELAQSAVSATVTALEGELAVRLFDKVGRNIRLTTAGKRLLPKARTLIAMADDIVASFAEAGTPANDGGKR